jgi:hypothetical protein
LIGVLKSMVTIYRQRVLERAGWVFWRCFASTWTLRKEEILNELLERISAMGIEPLGMMERAPSLVEKRIWKRGEPQQNGEAEVQSQPAQFHFEATPPSTASPPLEANRSL